jgi:hypothetical protein
LLGIAYTARHGPEIALHLAGDGSVSQNLAAPAPFDPAAVGCDHVFLRSEHAEGQLHGTHVNR